MWSMTHHCVISSQVRESPLHILSSVRMAHFTSPSVWMALLVILKLDVLLNRRSTHWTHHITLNSQIQPPSGLQMPLLLQQMKSNSDGT